MRAKAIRQEEVNSDFMTLASVHASESHWDMESFPLLFQLPVSLRSLTFSHHNRIPVQTGSCLL